MSRLRRALILWMSVLVTLTVAAQTNFVSVGNHRVHPTRILARFATAVPLQARADAIKQAGLKIHRQYNLVPGLVVVDDESAPGITVLRSGDTATQQRRLLDRIETLKQTGLFAYVEPDYIVSASLTPTDQAFVDGTLWALRNTGQSGGTSGADIGATAAWDITTGSTNVIVAIIDTGIRYTHQELVNQMWHNPGEIPGDGTDDDGNGYVDDVFGINAITGSGDPFDDNNHGTHVSGTIGAAANDGHPHVGISWHVQLMGCKFLDDQGFGATSDAIKCIDYAVSKGAKILNNSWGGGPFQQSLFDAIDRARRKGVLFVAAAGNASNDNDQSPAYPAGYQLDNIIAVAAIDRNDNLADFSNYGQTTVHLGAPGVSIFSSTAGSDSEYQVFNGTSMATPHVSGVAALILSHFPGAPLDEVRGRILLSAVPIPALQGKTITGGRLNAYNALTISGSGNLLVSVDPPSGSALLSSTSQPIVVKVTDVFGVHDATVTGSVAGVTNIIFANDGQPPDRLAGDDLYSASFQIPASSNTLSMTLVVSAPGKLNSTNLITYTVVSPPSNDNFANGVKVPAEGSLILSNNRFATIETGEPNHAGDTNVAASLWWVWSPANTTNALIDTTGSAIDTVVAVYTGSSLTHLLPIASANDVGQKQQAYLNFGVTAGQAYRIAVASADTNSLGSIRLRIAPGGHPDTTPPRVFVGNPSSGATVNSRQIQISGTAFDPTPDASGLQEVLVKVNGGIAIPASGTTNWTKTILLQQGYNTIAVRAADAAGNSSATAVIQVNYLPRDPANDLFANAIILSSASGISSVANANATKEFGEPIVAGNAGGKSVWWTWQAPSDGVLSLNTTNSTFDTIMGIFTGDRVDRLSLVAENDDASAGSGFSKIVQAVASNQTYRIIVDGFGGASGAVDLSYSFVPASTFTLTLEASDGGLVTPMSGQFPGNSSVVLTAIPNPGHVFSHWEGGVISSENPLTVALSTNLTLLAVFGPAPQTEDFETGDLLKLPWVTTGAAVWGVQTNVVSGGNYAARSGPITNSRSSSLVLTANFHSGSGAFDYQVSSEENWDFLEFYLGGNLVQRWSGETGWSRFTFVVPGGTNTLEWRYSKDASTSVGMDAAFLDNLDLPIVPPVDSTTPARLSIAERPGGNWQLEIRGQAGQKYEIQVSDKLIDWQVLATVVATNGVATFVDTEPPQTSARFYRAIVP